MADFLIETATHFNINNRCYGQSTCYYIPPEGVCSEGCAIGRKLTQEEKDEVKEHDLNESGFDELIGVLNMPEYFCGMPQSFVEDCQDLHDTTSYWNESGLSDLGKKAFYRISENFGLNADLPVNN